MEWLNILIDNNDVSIKYKTPDPMPMTPGLEAATNAIDHIYKKYPPPYTLMLSGGVDSQAMLWAWHKSGKAYNTFCGVYNNGFNENDIGTLREFSALHNIEVNFVGFDLLSFLQNEHSEYVHRYRCGSPHMTTFMKMSEQITEGTVIMSGNFIPHLFENRKITTTFNKPLITKNTFGLYRYGKMTNRSIIPFFFLETEELAHSFKWKGNKAAFLDTPKTQQGKEKLSSTRSDLPEYKNKVFLYQQEGFPVIPQVYKLTGFENVKDYFDEHFSHLIQPRDKLYTSIDNVSQRTFDLLLRNKYEAKYSTDKYHIMKIGNFNAS